MESAGPRHQLQWLEPEMECVVFENHGHDVVVLVETAGPCRRSCRHLHWLEMESVALGKHGCDGAETAGPRHLC